ncbi:hypothetical protein QFZ20_000790 [Flavobacterium sp. W4I14]|nr:hypothetical protein [Flavobacterium sp. W4I14]
MEQMNVEDSVKVKIDFSKKELPKSAQKLRPLVWKDGDSFCCLLGPDPKVGVFGCGDSPLTAIVDWDTHLGNRLAGPSQEDEVIQYVKDVYKADNTEVW